MTRNARQRRKARKKREKKRMQKQQPVTAAKAEASSPFEITSVVKGVNKPLGVVFGWALVSKAEGKAHVDRQTDHTPDHAILKSALDFAQTARAAKEMHDGPQKGSIPFLFPLTEEIAKALDIQTDKYGLLIGMKPTQDVLAKFESGEYTAFSIGGRRIRDRVVSMDELAEVT